MPQSWDAKITDAAMIASAIISFMTFMFLFPVQRWVAMCVKFWDT